MHRATSTICLALSLCAALPAALAAETGPPHRTRWDPTWPYAPPPDAPPPFDGPTHCDTCDEAELLSAPSNGSSGNGITYLNQRVVKRNATHPAGAAQSARASKAAVTTDDGALQPVGGSGTYSAATSAAYHPSGRFLYLEGVRGYRVDRTTGELVEIAGSPFLRAWGNTAWGAVAIEPSGRFLFAVDEDFDSVTAYRIDQATGALALVPGSPFATGVFPISVTVDGSGRYVYVANNALKNDVPSSISGYSLDRNTGALAPIPGSPWPAPSNAMRIAADPLGRYVYLNGSRFSAYAIDAATGALSPIGTPVDQGGRGIAVDPSGRFVYAQRSTGLASGIVAYAIGAGGALSQVGDLVAAGSNPVGIGVVPSGRYLYAANLLDGTISGYRIDAATGALAELASSPFPASENVFEIATGGGMPRADFADAGYPYSNRIAVYSGTPPYRHSIVEGALPAGLALDPDTGMVTGTPAATGTYNFTAGVTDANDARTYRDFVLTVSPNGQTPGSGNRTGLWWRAPAGSESGWGINFTHQGDVIFATWFTYGADGKPLWLAAVLNKAATGVYSGDVFTTTGPPFDAQPWDRAQVVETTVGTMSVTFAGDDGAVLDYTVNGIAQSKPLTRQAFGALPPCTWGGAPDLALATNFQGLWWKAPEGSESGWGANFTHQGDVIFVTWFTYDAAGKPWWLIAVARKKPDSQTVYEGPVSTVTGPPFSAEPWDPAQVAETEVGTLTLSFLDGNRASFAYTVNGVTQNKEVTRQVFAAPGTVCQ